MAETAYHYSVQNDFPNHKVAPDRLTQEIQQSAIVIALAYISVFGDDCSIVFKDPLTPGDKTILDGIVATHSGEPLPNPQPKVQSDGALVVAPSGLEGSELIIASHDFCRPSTWFHDSVRVAAEALVDSGDGLTFTSAHPQWIDMTHGYVLAEEDYCARVPHGYAVSVTVDGVPKTQQPPYGAGGDYTVNYAAGTVTSISGSWAGKVVRADYSYATDSIFKIIPDPGKAIDINEAEIQYAADVVMNDTISLVVWGWVQVFAPELWDGNVPPGPYPTNTLIPLPKGRRYMRVGQLIDEARGAYPVIPASGGPTRGMAQATIGYPFQYEAITRLWSKYGMELHARLESDLVFGGERATASFYCVSRDENTIT